MAPLRFPIPDPSLNLVWGSHGNLRQDPVEKTGSPMLPAIQCLLQIWRPLKAAVEVGVGSFSEVLWGT